LLGGRVNGRARWRNACSTPASTSRPSGEWNDDDFDVLTDGVVVGRIMKAAAVPVAKFGAYMPRTDLNPNSLGRSIC